MDSRRLYAGPQYPELESVAFERLAEHIGDQPDGVLYLARHDHTAGLTRDHWRSHGSPLSLTVDTFDGIVDHCLERADYEGPESRIDAALRNRLVELAVERLDEPSNPLATDRVLPAAGLCEHAEELLSLMEFAGLHSPEAIRDRLQAEGLVFQADTVAAVAATFEDAREDVIDDSGLRLRAERYQRILDGETPLTECYPSVEAVVFGGFSLFSPLERGLVERLADAWPTVALLPQITDAGAAIGVDRGAERALGTYDDLGFEREHVPPDGDRSARVAIPRRMYRPAGPAGEAEPSETTETPDLDLVQPETVPQELRHVARDIRSRIAAGTPPESIGIVLTDAGEYQEHVVETLQQYEVPATLTIDRSFGETALGEVLEELVALSRDDPPLESVTALLSNPLVTLAETDADLDRAELDRVAGRLASRRLASAYDHLEDDTAEAVRDLVEDSRALRDRSLGALPTAVEELLDRLGVSTVLEDLPRSPRGQCERDAASELERTLETLALTDGVADLERGDPLERLDRALASLGLGASSPREDGHVLVCDLSDATTRTFEHAYVLGLTAGHTPSNPERLAFTRPINEAHEDFAAADLQQRGRYHFGLLLAGDTSLTLSVPERTLGGDPYVEADVVTELRRVTDLDSSPVSPTETPPGCGEDVQRSLATTFAHEAVDNYPAYVDRAGEAGAFDEARRRRLQAGVACGAARASDDLTPYDGQLNPETVATLHSEAIREPYSPSRLETYATCGFKYFMGTVLDIEEPDDLGLEPDARDRGGYVHDVLEHYYADLQSESGEPVEIVSDPDDRAAHLLAVALERLEEWFDAAETAFQREWLIGVLAGLGDPDDNPYYGTGTYDAPETGILARFLEHEFEEVARATARPAWFEARVGSSRHGQSIREEPVAVETPSGDVPIHGMIDRVDVVPGTDPTQAVVRDYKTGSSLPGESDTLGGISFQLPIYAHLLEGIFEDVETVGGAYYQVSPPTDVNHRKGLVAGKENVDWGTTADSTKPFTSWGHPSFETHEAFRRFVDEEVPTRLGQLADALSAGRYQPTVLDPGDAGCRYCGYSDTCDVRPHRRRETIDAIDEEDDSAYVPLAARGTDPADVLEVE